MATPAELLGFKAVTSGFANVVLGRLDRVLANKYQSWKDIEMESALLKQNLNILAASVDDHQRVAPCTAVARAYGEEIRELTHNIEDCIERFLRRITCKPGAWRIRRSFHAIKTTGPRLRFAAKIRKLRNHVDDARKRALDAVLTVEVVQAAEYVPNIIPVGITAATMELLRLLDVKPSNIQAAAHLRVVALLGFGGSGKTILARVVYDKVRDGKAIPCAWVDGHSLDNMDAKGVQQNIHDQLGPGGMENRYLIVIDDIKDKHSTRWDTLKNALMGNGRILVTTTCQSTATRCCTRTRHRDEDRRNFGRVYTMRSLGEKDSKQIALHDLPGRDTPELASSAEDLLKQCGGLPLALYCINSRLSCEEPITGESCDTLCSDLGRYLEREDDDVYFANLRGVLRENYTSLSDYMVRTCLLYLGIFPMDHPLKKNVIIRRWLAEGYARHCKGRHQSVADKIFDTFMKRSIILPDVLDTNATGKSFKTRSIMHVFALHKSMSMKFIMPFGDEHEEARHFFIHGSNCGNFEINPNIDLYRVRSLTVIGNAGGGISNFSKYKLTRVLDLEGCTDVHDCHVRGICKLWNLRYLSLGPNITEIPKEIAHLKLLETLDVSKTRVNVLPLEAVGLPCLIHLIGKFKLQEPVKTGKLPKECMLEMVDGFVADKGRGFSQLMDHMKKLNKVKIWCECEETEQGQIDMNKNLSQAIKKYIEAPMHKGTIRSLSLYFQGLAEGSLTALDHISGLGHSYHLTSLKLHGNSSSPTLSTFLALFRDLKRLSISTTMSVTQHLLSVLGELSKLLCLKMTANSIDEGSFVIEHGKFSSLNRLSLVLNVVGTTVLAIKDGAQPKIISLKLICKDLSGNSSVEIRHLPELKEIVLHHDVNKETRQAWEAEAANHHNMPYVLSMPFPGVLVEANACKVETNKTVSMEEPAAAEEKPAHADNIIREEPAAAEDKPSHEDHTIRKELDEADEKPAYEDHIIREESAAAEVEPPAAATRSTINFSNSIAFHVINGAQEAGDQEALVLGAA